MHWKTLLHRARRLHPALLTMLCVLSAAMLIYAFAALPETHPISIAAYGLSAASLALVCLRLPAVFRRLQAWTQRNAFLVRYRSNLQLSLCVSLGTGGILNGLYALLQLLLGFWHRSAWFFAMAVYDALLAVMRLSLMGHIRRTLPGADPSAERRAARLCGGCLLAMTLALMVFILYFVFQTRTFVYHEITAIAMAVHAFAGMGIAVASTVRSRRFRSPVISAAREISLASAAVTMLTLENALLTVYGSPEQAHFRQIMLGVTGAAVLVLILSLALHLLLSAGKKAAENNTFA